MNQIQRIIVAVLGVLVVGLGVSNIYTYRRYAAIQANPQQAAQETVEKLVNQVKKLMILPENETPTVATVTDPAKLNDQPFFARAKAGDKVLIYTTARQAIIYDPENNIIVQVAPVTIGNNQQPVAPPPATSTVKP